MDWIIWYLQCVSFGRYANLVHDALKDLVAYREDFKEPCMFGFSRFSAAPLETLEPVISRIEEVVKKNG